MKNLYLFSKKWRLAAIVLFAVTSLSAQISQQHSAITAAIKQGNVETLTANFVKEIKVNIAEKDGSFAIEGTQMQTSGKYAKLDFDAKTAVQYFFTTNKVLDFHLLHNGTNENASFVIGKLKTENGLFRIYINYIKYLPK